MDTLDENSFASTVVARIVLTACLLVVNTCSGSAQDNKPVMIEATVMSVHDRLPPHEVRGVVVEEHYKVRLTGGSKVEEEWSTRPIATNSGAINIGGFSGTGSSALGEGGQHVVWKVLGAHRLQRVSEGRQFIEILDFEVREPHECSVQAKFSLEKGKTVMIVRRRDNGQFAEFSINRVMSATCSISK
jgi:hypothetical protein